MTKQKTNNFFLMCMLRKAGLLFGFALLLIAFLVRASPVTAATSSTINFQARLMTSGGAIVPDGYYNVEFKLYNAASSSGSSQGSCTGDANCLWTETRTSANTVRVANGYLTANLGSVTAFPGTISWDQQLWLSMNIGGTSGSPSWDGPMSPRLLLTSVPYAFAAGQLAATNGSFRSTLGFVQPTANRTIQAPDESGTICLQSSTSCGFAPSSGSGNYIQNQNSGDQTANFRITGTGRANISLQTPLLDTPSAGTLDIGTTNATAINLNKATVVTGGLTQSAGAVSLTANNGSSFTTSAGALTITAAATSTWSTSGGSLTVQAATTNTLNLRTGGAGTVAIGDINSTTINIGRGSNIARTINIGNAGTSTAQTVAIGSTGSTSTTTIQGGTGTGAIAMSTGTNGGITMTTNGTGTINLTTGSAGVIVKPTTDNGAAFQVQNAAGSYIFNVNSLFGLTNIGLLNIGISTNTAIIDSTNSGDTITIGSANAGTVTIGRAAGTTTIQGDTGTTLKATSGSFTTTLGFIVPTANRAINLPNESGTICLQGSTACNFAPTSGSGNYIQNTTTLQSANFFVQAASSGSVAGVLQANATGTGAILQLKNGAGTNVASVGSAGATVFQNSTNSTAGFQIQAAASGGGNAIFRVDTTNERVAIGVISDPIGAKLSIATGTGVTLRGYQGSTFDAFQLGNATADFFTVGATGNVLAKQTTNAINAFQVQNQSGGQMLNVDTVNNSITLQGNNSGQINSWKTTSSLAASTSFAGATIANGYAYMIGGYGSGYQATTQYAKINPDGSMRPWQTTTALPAARAYVGVTSATGYIYAMGGTPGSGNADTIYVGKQSPDGPVVAWQTSNVTLPVAMNAMSITVANGYLYMLGGTTGSPVANTYYSRLNGDGSVNAFQSGTALPAALANAQTVVSNGYIYYIGGYTGTSAVATVYFAPIDATTGAIGSWTATTSMPATANNFGATISNGYLYVYRLGSVYYAPFNTDGTLGVWTQSSNSIPVNYNGISALTYNGYNYVLGGYTGSAGTTGVYYTTGARTYVAGTLDLVGLTMQGSGATDDGGGAGSTGGALIAGNTSIIGSLQVQGQSSFAQNVSITGNLTLGDDRTDSDTVLTLASRNYSGIHLLSDMGNTGGEIGGAYILYAQDGWTVSSITGTVQVAGQSPQGDTYANTLGNAYLVGNYNNAAVQLGTNSTVRLTVTGGGSVCIGSTSCTKTLGVTGTIGASGAITANTTPDLAETIPAAPDVEAADVVMADPDNTERVIKSDRAYNAAALGVISDGSSSFMINSYGGSPDAPLTGAPLVLAGRVPVKVTDEGGSIKPGDALTSASKAGYAMKANRAGPTIGIALGSFNKATGTVLVLVKVGYYDPTPGVQGSNDNVNYGNINVAGDAVLNRLMVNDVTVNGSATIIGNLTVQGAAKMGTITIAEHIISKGNLPLLYLDNNVGKNATISVSGNDISGTVSVTTGTNAQPGRFIVLEFRKAYAEAPRVVISANNRESAVAQPYVDAVSGTGFVIGVTQTPGSGTELSYTYHVIQ